MNMNMNIGRASGVDYEVGIQSQNRMQNTDLIKQQNRLSEQPENKVSVDNTNNDEVDNEEVLQAAEEMTQWIQTWNTDIQFTIHEETSQLMVQVVDKKEQRVLKEFPSREFLDTVAKIHEYVGMLLDKKI